jgi:hypothetical protein
MATIVTTTTPAGTTTVLEPGPSLTEAFIADRQAFWGSFTRFVTMGAGAVVVLLILLAYFLG